MIFKDSCVMKSTVINTSKEMTAYSDFPPEPGMANFMHNAEMYRYLHLYVDHFELKKCIKFNHKVIQISRSNGYLESGQWTVKYEDELGNHFSEVFDGVLLCCGHHAIPRLPSPWPDQERFKGRIIHSHSYRSHKGYEDKVAVIVGIGNSGGDLAVELSRVAKQTYLSTRRGTWVFNRIYDYGEPFDLALNRKYLQHIQGLLPQCLVNTFVESKLNKRFDHERYGLKPRHRIFRYRNHGMKFLSFYNFFGVALNYFARWYRLVGPLFFHRDIMKQRLPNRIACGTVRMKPNIRQFTENGVIFEDGSEVNDVDVIILATGFKFHFPIVENGELIPVHENVVELYEYMFPIETSDHNSLAVIGLIQPVGSIMPISEMQARVFYENLFGSKKIPGKDKMKKWIREKQDEMRARYVKSPRHTIQVDYIPYMDELANIVGCRPNIVKLILSDPLLAYKVGYTVFPY
uniref:Flavin-containing monooxygenase n=1 Tax=Angiostrongylus cantonensis TaxID=6313 RepID=A0A0K0DPN8_ANGCA